MVEQDNMSERRVVTDKHKCFELFEKGFQPGSHELEDVASRPTAYKYYKEWLLQQIAYYSIQAVITGQYESKSFMDKRKLQRIKESLRLGKDLTT